MWFDGSQGWFRITIAMFNTWPPNDLLVAQKHKVFCLLSLLLLPVTMELVEKCTLAYEFDRIFIRFQQAQNPKEL